MYMTDPKKWATKTYDIKGSREIVVSAANIACKSMLDYFYVCIRYMNNILYMCCGGEEGRECF